MTNCYAIVVVRGIEIIRVMEILGVEGYVMTVEEIGGQAVVEGIPL